MDCSEAIRARRSVRKYKKGEKIPPEYIRMMLEAAMSAPSAVNSRPWEFYVTESDEIKERLMQAHPASRMLETAFRLPFSQINIRQEAYHFQGRIGDSQGHR